MGLLKETISSGSFAALVACDIRLEPTPLLFRCQPNVELILNFRDYLTFRKNTKEADEFLLSAEQFKQVITPMTDTDTLQRSFLMDVAVAIGKEVYYAESQNAEGTRITHRIPTVASITSKEIENQLSTFSLLDVDYFINFMSSKGYIYKSLKPELNKGLWDYALLCAYTAKYGDVWSFKC